MKNNLKRLRLFLTSSIFCAIGLAILSPTIAFAEAAEPIEELRVLTYNIQIGIGMDRQVDLDRTAEVIRKANPDLVALQEVDRLADRSDGVDQAAVLAEKLGMDYAFGYASTRPGGEYGVMILSRWPVLKTSNYPLPFVGNNETRTVLSALIEIPNLGEIRFLSAHLQNALSRRDERLMQIERINELFAKDDIPTILGADLNAAVDTPEMELMKTVWTDATASATGDTYPADKPTIRIDYIFVRKNDPWQIRKAEIVDEPLASDHRPVLAVLIPEWKPETGRQ